MSRIVSSLPSCDARTDSCHLCGDEAIPGRVLALDLATRTAIVALEGEPSTVALDLVDARVGDVLLVHMGFAIARLEQP